MFSLYLYIVHLQVLTDGLLSCSYRNIDYFFGHKAEWNGLEICVIFKGSQLLGNLRSCVIPEIELASGPLFLYIWPFLPTKAGDTCQCCCWLARELEHILYAQKTIKSNSFKAYLCTDSPTSNTEFMCCERKQSFTGSVTFNFMNTLLACYTKCPALSTYLTEAQRDWFIVTEPHSLSLSNIFSIYLTVLYFATSYICTNILPVQVSLDSFGVAQL